MWDLDERIWNFSPDKMLVYFWLGLFEHPDNLQFLILGTACAGIVVVVDLCMCLFDCALLRWATVRTVGGGFLCHHAAGGVV